MISSAQATQRTGDGAAAAALFDRLLDDAALFPPQRAAMADALRDHRAHRSGTYGRLQGTFVVAASRLAEALAVQRENAAALARRRGDNAALGIQLENEAGPASLGPEPDRSAGLGHGLDAADVLQISLVVDYKEWRQSIAVAGAALRAAGASNVSVRAIELRLPSASVPAGDLEDACATLLRFMGDDTTGAVFLESARMNAAVAEAERLAEAIEALRRVVPGFVGAKLRTGGLTADALPASETVAQFIAAMRDCALSWKATAGLHHPVRGVYRGQTMHGFLNVLAATIGAHANVLGGAQLVEVLEATDPADFRLATTTFAWRDVSFDVSAIAAARRDSLRSVGSCSFDEPVDDLRELGMLA